MLADDKNQSQNKNGNPTCWVMALVTLSLENGVLLSEEAILKSESRCAL